MAGLDRKTVQRILTRHYEVHETVPQIASAVHVSMSKVHDVIITSWHLHTQSSLRVSKEL